MIFNDRDDIPLNYSENDVSLNQHLKSIVLQKGRITFDTVLKNPGHFQ